MNRPNVIQSDRDTLDNFGLTEGDDVGIGPHAVHDEVVTATDD